MIVGSETKRRMDNLFSESRSYYGVELTPIAMKVWFFRVNRSRKHINYWRDDPSYLPQLPIHDRLSPYQHKRQPTFVRPPSFLACSLTFRSRPLCPPAASAAPRPSLKYQHQCSPSCWPPTTSALSTTYARPPRGNRCQALSLMVRRRCGFPIRLMERRYTGQTKVGCRGGRKDWGSTEGNESIKSLLLIFIQGGNWAWMRAIFYRFTERVRSQWSLGVKT